MIAWIFLLVLLVAEGVGVTLWLRREFLPVFFNGFAGLIYSLVLAVDFVLTWLVSNLVQPGGTGGTAFLAIVGVAQLVIAVLFTLFFRWLVRTDMTDIK
jgi:uncharacterized membrane protein YhdT